MKKEEGKKPGCTILLSDAINKCGKTNNKKNQAIACKRTDLYFILYCLFIYTFTAS